MKTGPIAVVFLVVFCLKIDAQQDLPFEIGAFRYLADKPEDCPEGYQCSTFEVNCTGSEPARGVVAYAAHTAGKPKGLIMLFKGEGYASLFSELGYSRAVKTKDWEYIAIRYPEDVQ